MSINLKSPLGGGVILTPASTAVDVVHTVLADGDSSGSSLVGFIQSGTGAVARTVQAKLGESVSVFDCMTAAQIDAVQTDNYSVVTYTEITAALNVSVNSFPVVGGNTTNMHWTLPKGTFRINGPINFPTGKLYYPQLTFEGQIFQTNAAANGLVFDEVYFGVIKGVHVDTTWDAWANVRAGIKFNTLANTILDINRASNFEKGLQLNAGPGATAYNTINLSFMRYCKYGVYATPDGSVTNFVNANSFIGGNFQNNHLGTISGDVGIYISGFNYGNSFYDQIFESIHTGFNLSNANGFLVSKPYYETTTTYANLVGAASGTWIHGHEPFDQTKLTTDSQTRRITFLNTGNATNVNVASMETDASGIRWKQYVAGTSYPSITAKYEPYFGYNCLVVTDHMGGEQVMNKSYTTSTNAPPTVGSFVAGAVCWNSTGTIGQPSGWVCRQLGTAGTLVGITADTTVGTKTVTVSSVAGLAPGMYINIAGAYAAVSIGSISGTTLTMISNATGTVAGVTVTYFAPLWRALANFA